MAEGYDSGFTESAVGTLMRRAVWRRTDAVWGPGDRVLELNCGTGEDAVHLARRGVRVVATDVSEAMLERARAKVAAAGVEHLVEVRRMAIEELGGGTAAAAFDGALSNFGGLNCVADLAPMARALASCLRPGGMAALCLMGPFVPWEWVWFLGRGRLGEAFRRLRPGGARWRGLTIRYPSIRAARRALAPAFRLRRAAAVGALLPPTYAEGWARAHPRWLARLDRWERRCETWPPLPWLADHYLLELERR
ncbi:MAG TPA: class I SAM-dependent methyltransferase [Thermoanaerobaculia bacterium]|nr:class I SAM-dependent methyltransferase [Thermoanaerobaculia bacterium]